MVLSLSQKGETGKIKGDISFKKCMLTIRKGKRFEDFNLEEKEVKEYCLSW